MTQLRRREKHLCERFECMMWFQDTFLIFLSWIINGNDDEGTEAQEAEFQTRLTTIELNSNHTIMLVK